MNRQLDAAAEQVRRAMTSRGALLVHLLSAAGAGKTSLLEATIRALRPRWKLAVIEGDAASDLDAGRLCRLGIPVREVLTGGTCHLTADQVLHEIGYLGRDAPDLIFIENVGGLVGPAQHDLGEDLRVVLLSVVEGDDRPQKYPRAFAGSAAVLVTKADLQRHARFDVERVRAAVRELNPQAALILTSAAGGRGLAAWCRFLEGRLREKRRAAAGAVRLRRRSGPAPSA